jgi:hypothetical protein
VGIAIPDDRARHALLRAFGASLALTNPVEALRMVYLAPTRQACRGLERAPHLLRPPVTAAQEACEALASLHHAREVRAKRGETAPRVVALIDAPEALFPRADVARRLVRDLTRRGHEVGIHLIVGSASREGLSLEDYPLRITEDEVAALSAANGGGAVPFEVAQLDEGWSLPSSAVRQPVLLSHSVPITGGI